MKKTQIRSRWARVFWVVSLGWMTLGGGLAGCWPFGGSGASVYFVEPQDGATVSQKFTVKFGVKGMRVHPAGELIEGTGHHHLIVNGPAIATGQVVPADERHIHYGLGQTETELELVPGDYQLTLQFADGAHVSYGPKMSQTIRVSVR